MGYQPLEKLLPKAGNSIYKLVRMASLRATELADGMPRLIDIPSSTKTSTIALEEILAGRVVLKEVVEDNPPPPGTVVVEKQEKEPESEEGSEESAASGSEEEISEELAA